MAQAMADPIKTPPIVLLIKQLLKQFGWPGAQLAFLLSNYFQTPQEVQRKFLTANENASRIFYVRKGGNNF